MEEGEIEVDAILPITYADITPQLRGPRVSRESPTSGSRNTAGARTSIWFVFITCPSGCKAGQRGRRRALRDGERHVKRGMIVTAVGVVATITLVSIGGAASAAEVAGRTDQALVRVAEVEGRVQRQGRVRGRVSIHG
jgi:hypothetical protein